MSATRQLPFWRSLLFVPATNSRFIERAHERQADAIILDLEDSIPLSEKTAARAGLNRAIDQIAGHGCQILVRVNNVAQQVDLDLARAVRPGVFAIDIPKVAGRVQLQLLDDIVSSLEERAGLPVGGIRFKLIIETAAAMLDLPDIARYARENSRIIAMTLGNEDLAAELGIEPSVMNLFHACQQIVVAARAGGVLPLGFPGSVSDFRDLGRFRRNIRRARAMGFVGSSCIHPSHVAVLNEEFTPTELELSEAQRIILAAEKASNDGVGAFDLDGRMIDEPIILRARRLYERAGRNPHSRDD